MASILSFRMVDECLHRGVRSRKLVKDCDASAGRKILIASPRNFNDSLVWPGFVYTLVRGWMFKMLLVVDAETTSPNTATSRDTSDDYIDLTTFLAGKVHVYVYRSNWLFHFDRLTGRFWARALEIAGGAESVNGVKKVATVEFELDRFGHAKLVVPNNFGTGFSDDDAVLPHAAFNVIKDHWHTHIAHSADSDSGVPLTLIDNHEYDRSAGTISPRIVRLNRSHLYRKYCESLAARPYVAGIYFKFIQAYVNAVTLCNLNAHTGTTRDVIEQKIESTNAHANLIRAGRDGKISEREKAYDSIKISAAALAVALVALYFQIRGSAFVFETSRLIEWSEFACFGDNNSVLIVVLLVAFSVFLYLVSPVSGMLLAIEERFLAPVFSAKPISNLVMFPRRLGMSSKPLVAIFAFVLLLSLSIGVIYLIWRVFLPNC